MSVVDDYQPPLGEPPDDDEWDEEGPQEPHADVAALGPGFRWQRYRLNGEEVWACFLDGTLSENRSLVHRDPVDGYFTRDVGGERQLVPEFVIQQLKGTGPLDLPLHPDHMFGGVGQPAPSASPAVAKVVRDALTVTTSTPDESLIDATDEVPWPELDPAALHGIAGRVVEAIRPHTEADPVAVLITFLAAVANLISSGPHALVGGARHPARIFPLIVGQSAKSRKGTSFSVTDQILRLIDEEWRKNRVSTGLSSGEGLIAAVADSVVDGEGKEISPGSRDKRLFVREDEFARTLTVSGRDSNTLSAVIRSAWDNGDLKVMTKVGQSATDAHITILGHITVEELKRKLTDTDIANGFANRFLFVCAKRGPLLPSGGNLDPAAVAELVRDLRSILDRARRVGDMKRSEEAEKRWDEIYREIAVDDPGGLLGSLTARGDAQTLRLSVAYAILDGSSVIELEHVEAAYAMWRYCRASAEYIFGDAIGDENADKLLRALREAGDAGLDFTRQSDVFKRNLSKTRLDAARETLESKGLACTVIEEHETGGRPRTVTRAVRKGA